MVSELIAQITEFGPFLVMSLGFVVGLGHAFEPDHIAAISTQISKIKSHKVQTRNVLKSTLTKAAILGALWGAGHTTTLVMVGFLTYVLALSISPQIFSILEFVVGIMLVLFGNHYYPHQG